MRVAPCGSIAQQQMDNVTVIELPGLEDVAALAEEIQETAEECRVATGIS